MHGNTHFKTSRAMNTERRQIKDRMVRFYISLILLLATACLGAACSDFAFSDADESRAGKGPKKITILYFNDLHGHLAPFKRKYSTRELSGGFARLGYLVKKIRKENANKGIDTLVFSAGDNFQGTPMSTAFKGEAEFSAFNELMIDAAAVGNHDFDYSADNLFELAKMARFPIISATVYQLNGSEAVFKPDLILTTKNGIKVGMIGLTTPETPITTHPRNVFDLRFVEPPLAMQRHFEKLKKQSDILIALSHLGLDEDRKLAGLYPGLDLIIGGHTHSILPEPLKVGEVLIAQAGDRGLYLGRLDLEVEKRNVKVLSAQLISVDSSIPEDPGLKALVDSYSKMLSAEIGRVIGQTEVFLDGERGNIRTRETNLGNFIADLMRIRTNTDISFINGGAIRASLMPGEITLEDVMRVFPMNDDIIMLELSGEDIYFILKRSIQGLLSKGPDALFGGFLQVSGISFMVKDWKVTNIRINGEALNLFKTYSVATGDFLASGGDGYKEFKQGRHKYNTGITFRDIFVNYLREHRTIKAKTDGRIVRD